MCFSFVILHCMYYLGSKTIIICVLAFLLEELLKTPKFACRHSDFR